MEKMLEEQPLNVSFDGVYLDPNNPRLALDKEPGYEDANALFDGDLQKEVEEQLRGVYGAQKIRDLRTAIRAQGWLPIDNIVVWMHPDVDDKCVVVEGNTRILVLREIRRNILPAERKKLERIESTDDDKYDIHDLKEKRKEVKQLEQIVKDTEKLGVKKLDAETVEELKDKLPRVLAVRHVTGVRGWDSYAEDLWLRKRYLHLFREKHGSDDNLFWDPSIIRTVADEASLSPTMAKRKIRAVTSFVHFQMEYADRLPEGEEFSNSDYFLFENISKKPRIRQKLGYGEDDLHIPEQGEEALFKWVFEHPRGSTADENPNVFHRHQNVLLWDRMQRYDEANNTSFAARFDVENPDDAPQMQSVRAEWESYKASQEPREVLDNLLKRFQDLTAQQLAEQGEAFTKQLEEIHRTSKQYLRMIKAAEADGSASVAGLTSGYGAAQS